MKDLINLKQLWPYIKTYRGAFFLTLLFTFIHVAMGAIGPYILGLAITELGHNIQEMIQGVPGAGVNFDYIAWITLIYFVRGVVNAVSQYLGAFNMTKVTQNVTFDLRTDVSAKLNRLPVSFFDRYQTGEILSRVTSDIEAISNAMSQSIIQVIAGGLQIILALIMIILISPGFLLMILIMIGVIALVTRFLLNWSQPAFKKQANALGHLFSLTQEHLSGFTEVKLYNQEPASIEDFALRNSQVKDAAFEASLKSALTAPTTNLISNLTYAFVVLVGGLQVIQGQLALGNLQALVDYVDQVNSPVTMITQTIGVIQSAGAASSRVFQLLNEDEEVQTHDGSIQLPQVLDGRVKFDHVQFGYQPDQPLMTDISFEALAGQTIAIVGPTGAGKTTLINLLMRFYDVDAGAILVDDINIKDVSRSDLRSHISLVLQDTWLFKGTIKDNIRFGKIDATDEEIVQAAKIANVDHFIRTLPKGYDEEIEADGGGISQGQKQLLTIARAVISDPDILILDEATSSVDTRLEKLIQEAMDRVMEGRTSFVIAHRLSTIRNADLILVIKDGDIIETGDHDSLLAADGFYADLYQAQFSKL